MPDRATLVTGASSGIGAELARVFSDNGHHLALVARNADKLRALADEIEARGRRRPFVIVCDLAETGAGLRIASALTVEGLDIDTLVNNAGYGLSGAAFTLDRADQMAMVDVNVRALTDLSLRFAESLVRYRGGILNVASVVSYMPAPGMAVYAATKAYVLSFSEALHQELAPQGVRVCALCPGPVPSGFQERAGMRADMRSTPIDMPADEVARQGYTGLMRGRRVVLPGVPVRILPFLLRLTPRRLLLWSTARTMMRRTP